MNRPMSKPTTDLLRQIPLFSTLADRDLESLAEEFNERRFPAGHAVALEGEGGLVFFVVESGEATVEVHGETVGTLEWDATSTQQTIRYALMEDGSIDDAHPVYVCTEDIEGTQTGLVTVVER